MRIGPAVHGALLIAALLFAYETWTRDTSDKPTTGEVVVWNEATSAFESLKFVSPTKEVVIESRSDNHGSYLWGAVTRKPSPPPVAKPKGPAGIPGHGNPHGAHPTSPIPKPTTAKPTTAKPTTAKPAPKTKPGETSQAKPASGQAKAATKPNTKKPSQKPAAKDGKMADQNGPIPTVPKQAAKPANLNKTKKPASLSNAKKTASPAAGAGQAATSAPPVPVAPIKAKATIKVREFPLGDAGEQLVKNFSELRALRSFGTPNDDEKIEFGLDETDERLTVTFKGGSQHTLLIGDRVFGGSDRYVLDEATGHGFVLSSKVMRDIESAETSLGLKKYNNFDSGKDLHKIAITVGEATQSLVRLAVDDKKSEKKKERRTWARSETPGSEDVTMANFIDRASKLRPVKYLTELKVDSLNLLARFNYYDPADKKIGYLEFYKGKDPSQDAPKEEYYMKTERTRVLGKVSKLTAERVEQDLIEVFSTQQKSPAPEGGEVEDVKESPTE